MLTKPSSRSGARLSTLKIQPPSASRCAPTARPLSQRGIQSTTPNPITSALATLRKDQCLHQPSKSATPHLLRFASTSAADQDTTTTAPGQPTTSHPPSLTWNEYLSLRKVRRRYNLAASIVTSLGTTSAGITVLSQQNVVSEQLGGLFGLDPFILLGLATASSGAVGWLLGPFVGNAVFGMVHRRVGREIAEKEKDFYTRIKRYRVDPSSQSFSNPVPDYYGEKIGSVSEFRNWMKDQRAYNKKRQSFL